MTKTKLAFVIVMTLFGMSRLAPPSRAADHGDDNSKNLARGRSYTFSSPPSYKLTVDSGDATQLTDGVSRGADWRQRSTVGWSRGATRPYVVIDLGSVQPIDEVRVHSVGGGKANVFYPANIALLVSDDGRTFHMAGAADSLDLPQNRSDPIAARRTPHVFRMTSLGTRGRYVLVLLDYDGVHLFVDEIEVLRGSHDPQSVTFDPGNNFSIDAVRKALPLAREYAEARLGLTRWLRAAKGRTPDPRPMIQRLQAELRGVRWHDLDALRAIENRIGLARGRWLGVVTGRRFVWTRANPMVQFRPFDLPARLDATCTDDSRRIDVSLWQGEYESAAVSLFNCGTERLNVKPVLTPLRSPTEDMLYAGDTITLRRAAFVDARGAGRIGDALVKIPDGGIRIEPGRAEQLWLTFHNPKLIPGTYHFAIDLAVRSGGASAVSSHEMVQGTLTVQPIQFPDDPTLSTYTWAFVERADLTKDVPEEAVADLRAHYVNTDVLFWSKCLPMPRLDSDGHVNLRFKELYHSLKRYHDNDLYMFYWGLGRFRKNVPHMPAVGTKAWRVAIKDWMTKWTTFLKDQGVDYDRFIMYPFDEMLPDEFLAFARFIKEDVDPRIRFFANSRGDKNGKQMARLAPYIDVWCFRDIPYGARIAPTEQRVRRGASSIWSYDAARPAKGKPPQGYYRLQMWRAFARGDTGCGFWTYSDPGEGNGDAWDDFNSTHGKYGVIYGPIGKPPGVDLSGERIVPSRRWEAWREGVEDYEYLSLLRKAIIAARRAGDRGQAIKAQAVLDRALKRVLEHPGEPDRVYEARRDITAELLRLTRANTAGQIGS